MHIPDAVLDPRVAVATSLAGAAGLIYCLRRVERQLKDRTTPLMGMMAAFIFAAQMVNFPVGPGVSGHLLGGVLASVVLGPWAGAAVIGAVLIVQCFLFGDGGLTALGANFLNMGILGAVVGHTIYTPLQQAIGGRRGIVFGAMMAAWFSVLLAAGACAIELSAFGNRHDFLRVLTWLAIVHAAIGIGEALITGMAVRFVLQTRPDLLERASMKDDESLADAEIDGRRRGWLRPALAGLGIALAVAVFLAPFASEKPDGLEFVGEKTGVLEEGGPAISFHAPLNEYELPLPGIEQVQVATAAAGVIGTLVVFAMSWGLAKTLEGVKVIREGGNTDAL